jgi:hypothetical protein
VENEILTALFIVAAEANFDSEYRISANYILPEIGQDDYLDTLLGASAFSSLPLLFGNSISAEIW